MAFTVSRSETGAQVKVIEVTEDNSGTTATFGNADPITGEFCRQVKLNRMARLSVGVRGISSRTWTLTAYHAGGIAWVTGNIANDRAVSVGPDGAVDPSGNLYPAFRVDKLLVTLSGSGSGGVITMQADVV